MNILMSKKRQRRNSVLKAIAEMQEIAETQIAQLRKKNPIIATHNTVVQQLEQIRSRRVQLEADFMKTKKKMSWWDQLVDAGEFESRYNEMNKKNDNSEQEINLFLKDHAKLVQEVEIKFISVNMRIESRLQLIKESVINAIPEKRRDPFNGDTIARNALILSALSIPISAWQDISQASEIYDTLRSVNGNFVGMSDSEIWFQTLAMESESLAGLASLTKGAVFEAHVAENTGGILHEHFNTPDTDIVIDGMSYQIKATDSVDYIKNIDSDIPVIATSEVAAETGVIDGGMTNAELDTVTGLALGGSVIDTADTMSDAIIAGFGGIGVFAALRGINHTIDLQRKGIDKSVAIAQGVGIAIIGTAKATVNTAEMGYKVVTSRPSRFLGRLILKIGKGIGKRMDRS